MFVSADKNGEYYLQHDGEYNERDSFFKSILKTIDFAFAKDSYTFKTSVGTYNYTFGIFFLNIIMLNIVIALVGDKYDEVT